MGKHRAGAQRRQQKAQERRRRRARERTRPRPDSDGRTADADSIDATWRVALLAYGRGDAGGFDECLALLTEAPTDHVDAFVWDDFCYLLLPTLWNAGWQPGEVAHVVRKDLQKTHEHLLNTLVLEQSHRYRKQFPDPHWFAQLDSLRRVTEWPELPEGPGLVTRFGSRLGLDRTLVVRVAIELAARLESLPSLPVLGPRPGDRFSSHPAHSGLPVKLLEKVQGLLRKAETTEYPAEAEAFTAKAQQLVGRHGMQSILDSLQGDARERPVARRVLIDGPHADGKALLLQQIAQANRCRTAWVKDLGMSSVSGFAVDVDFVELLHASLLVQATRAMTAYGSVADASGTRRTASFRKSFMVSYAGRIGQRLADGMREAEADADDGRLLPVLQSRTEEVDALFTATFGEGFAQRVSTSHEGGAVAGYAAAGEADLKLFDELESA